MYDLIVIHMPKKMKIEKIVRDKLLVGTIRSSVSPFSSLVLLIYKKNITLGVCVLIIKP